MNKSIKLLLLLLFTIRLPVCTAQTGEELYKNAVLLRTISGYATQSNNENLRGIYGFDVGYAVNLEPKPKEWSRFLNAKDVIWTIYWRNLNGLKTSNNQVMSFGNAWGISMSANFQLWDARFVQFDFIPTIGISYFSRTSFVQYSTAGVGSQINDLVSAEVKATVPLNKQLSVFAGGNYMHFSNAGFKNPNGGISTKNIELGLRANFNRVRPNDSLRNFSYLHPLGSSFEFSAGIGKRGVFDSHKGLYRSGLYGGYNYFFNQALALKVGVDGWYYYTVYDPAQPNETFQEEGTSFDHWSAGISIGTDIAMNRFVVNGQVGKYIHFNGLDPTVKWYWYGGFRYYLTPELGIQSTVYIHRTTADYINWGLVYRFKRF